MRIGFNVFVLSRGVMENTSQSQNLVEINNLHKSFGEAQAVNGISFSIPKGQVVGFLGPNGAGKSTTMRMMMGYLQPSKGEIFVCGTDVVAAPVAAREQVGYLPENNPLYEEMMVIDYLNFIADIRSIPSERKKEAIHSVIERCGLQKVVGKDISMLSKGYRQRVGLAQAIIHDPQLLILDEPTTGLDPNQIIEIRDLIRDLGREKTVIMSTHILSEVQSTCSRVIIINDGQLVADDSTQNLLLKEGGNIHVALMPKNSHLLKMEQIKDAFAPITQIASIQRVKEQDNAIVELMLHYEGKNDPRRAIFEQVVQNDWILLEMHRKEVSLEETFRKLTAN